MPIPLSNVNSELTVLGLMSGSSLDGIDLAVVRFHTDTSGTIQDWQLLDTTTVPFDDSMKKRLSSAPASAARELCKLDVDLGESFANAIAEFLKRSDHEVDLVASHGHTIFHFPGERFTTQIGNGASMASILRVPVISDFRSNNVAEGGSGAPMAPLVDKLLFSEYDNFLNLGGIANVFSTTGSKPVAFDSCPCNQLLNYFAGKMNLEYDIGGRLALSGKVRHSLLDFLDEWEFYHSDERSLDNTSVSDLIDAIDQGFDYGIPDTLRTCVEHIGARIATDFSRCGTRGSILATGGGAKNLFLMQILKSKLKESQHVVLPDNKIIDFKEAILIALAGLRRWFNLPVFDAELSGSESDSFGGAVYWGSKE